MHHILRTFSDEDTDKIAVITAGTRKDNVALATARRASRKASNPPGCTISYLIRLSRGIKICSKVSFPMHP
ncbi:hypothetical protein GFK18_14335 [Salmonella enterica subsp. enterica serovar Enteritidis]|nr:hypothetical protein [Salmonella enterica subsp. enterica serovar Enteritidis]